MKLNSYTRAAQGLESGKALYLRGQKCGTRSAQTTHRGTRMYCITDRETGERHVFTISEDHSIRPEAMVSNHYGG